MWCKPYKERAFRTDHHHREHTERHRDEWQGIGLCLVSVPTQKNSDGDYGLPSIEPTEVEIPTILATGINPEIRSHPADADHTGKPPPLMFISDSCS